MPTPPNTEVACPHYAPAQIGNPNFLCPGCGSLVADHRHTANQALGMTAATLLSRPEVRQQTRNPLRRGY